MRIRVAIAGLALLVAGCPATQNPAGAPPETKPPKTQQMVTIEPAPAPTPADPAVVTVAPAAEPEAIARLPEAEPIRRWWAARPVARGAAGRGLALPRGGVRAACFPLPRARRRAAPRLRGAPAAATAAERRCLRGLLAAKRGAASTTTRRSSWRSTAPRSRRCSGRPACCARSRRPRFGLGFLHRHLGLGRAEVVAPPTARRPGRPLSLSASAARPLA